MKKYFKQSSIRTISTLLAIFLALPLSLETFTGLYAWFSPFISLNSIFLLKTFVWLNLISLLILVMSLFRKNWFCRYLCPVGLGCDFISGFARSNSFKHKRFPDISQWIALISLAAALFGLPLFILLDPMAIFNGFFSVFAGKSNAAAFISLSGLPLLLMIHLFFPGLWCGKICPLGGLQKFLWKSKPDIKQIFNRGQRKSSLYKPGRRFFLASGFGILSGIIIPKLLRPAESPFLRPPASTGNDVFNTLCIRCGNCIKACPTNIIVHHQVAENLLSWMTPEVRFDKGYCLETCNLCGKVCPSGSITLFSVQAKRQIYMGTAVINTDQCLLMNNRECDRCLVSCKYDALEIVRQKNGILATPVIIYDKCVGCGACAVICPVNIIEIVPLVS